MGPTAGRHTASLLAYHVFMPRLQLCALSLAVAPAALLAQAPPNYYQSIDATSAATLRATLHDVIDDHQRFPYTSGATDTWDILKIADQDPTNSGRILDVYRNATYPKATEALLPVALAKICATLSVRIRSGSAVPFWWLPPS